VFYRQSVRILLMIAILLIVPADLSFAEEEQLPIDKSGAYGFYLGEKTPYFRLSPHRCETVDADGEKQPRRIAAVYALADLRQFGGKLWSPKTDPFSVAYSSSPTATARSGTRYIMQSPEQAGLDAGTAEQLRAIAAAAYPFRTAEEMLTALEQVGIDVRQEGTAVDGARGTTESMSEGELLTAVQTAVWSIAGKQGTLTEVYTVTDATGRTDRTLHPDAYAEKAASYVQVEKRIRAVSDYLAGMDTALIQADQPLTGMAVAARYDVSSKKLRLQIRPNGTVNADDSLLLTVGETTYALLRENGEHPVLLPDENGIWMIESDSLQAGEKLTIRLRGTQHTERDVCLYIPQDGDVSESLVGVFGGAVAVDLSETIKADDMNHLVRLRCVTELCPDGPQWPLADAGFSLYLLDASHGLIPVAEDLRTDEDGLLTVSDLLTPNKGERYVFLQTDVPEGYRGTGSDVIFADAAAAVRVENTPADTAAVSLTLTDDWDAAIADGSFALYRQFGVESVLIGEYRTDAAGQICVEHLPAGSYRFLQQEVPAGYTAKTQTYPFQIRANAGNVSVSAKNYAYRLIEGDVRFVQCDPPSAVCVSLLRDGAVFATQTVSEETAWRYRFADVPVVGTYTVVQEPIAGYRAQIDEQGIVNSRRQREVAVRQRMAGKASGSLRGAVFSLHSAEDGTHIRTVSSDAAGTITFRELAAGAYVLRERRAPAGIRPTETSLYLTVSDPNTRADADAPMLVRLETEDGSEIADLCLVRESKGFFGLGVRGVFPILTVAAILAAVACRPMIVNPKKHLYSGRTRLCLLKETAEKNRVLRFIRRLVRKH